ncbi:hypothetical protein PATSB16_24040 [Pandoraea thiooxydans]|nr:hypothetical protein PATSB16_24040 [Pandoraea thiooxydans]
MSARKFDSAVYPACIIRSGALVCRMGTPAPRSAVIVAGRRRCQEIDARRYFVRYCQHRILGLPSRAGTGASRPAA